MKNLELIKNENGKEAVQCSLLYESLGLNVTHYSRWIKKNITNNPLAKLNSDFAPLSSPNGEINEEKPPLTRPTDGIKNRQRNEDFVLSLDFAKHLAMMCRTKKGYEVREYFLQCEKQAQSKELKLFNELMQELTNYRRIEALRVQRIELNRELRSIKKQMQENEPRQIPAHGIQLSLLFN